MTIPARLNPWARRRLLACSFTFALAGMAAVTAVTAALAPAPVLAQQATWPARPVRLVVGYAAGGATDVIARLVAARMGEQLGQSVVVDNRTGANSNVGAEAVARAPADGYTL
jgi:tripartite-type tricarboxylate transporter receptor subunit TctC